MLNRILIPLDGSTCADQALAYALALAKAEGARIDVYAFVDPRAILGRDLANPLEEEHTAAAMAEARRGRSRHPSEEARPACLWSRRFRRTCDGNRQARNRD